MHEPAATPIRTGQIILGAMAAGLVVLLIVTAALSARLPLPHDERVAKILLVVLLLLGLMELLGFWVVRTMLREDLRKGLGGQPPTPRVLEQLGHHMLAATLIPAAMLEGWGLFGGVVYLITGAVAALVAPVIALIGLVGLLPSRDKFARFVTEITGQSWP